MSGQDAQEQDRPTGEDPPKDVYDIELLKAMLEDAERERSQFRDLLQRVQADSLNFKRRMEEEREGLYHRFSADLVLKLLSILDDHERALQNAPDVDSVRPWAVGVEMVYRNFKGVLESLGLTHVEALGNTFDPLEHEAVLHEVNDDREEGMVTSVVREGYKLHGRILRPAQVVVSKRADWESTHREGADSREKEMS
jgi:molecular chaperone GrpE